ncbi:MAG: hypothetical protein QXG00_07680, partial [Candidatus Woesearchaeota archaeon]
EEAERIHNSTRVDIPLFSPVHNYLRAKSATYYKWSISPKSTSIHFAAVVGFVVSFIVFTFIQYILPNIFSPKAETVQAGSNSHTWTTYEDFTSGGVFLDNVVATSDGNLQLLSQASMNPTFNANNLDTQHQYFDSGKLIEDNNGILNYIFTQDNYLKISIYDSNSGLWSSPETIAGPFAHNGNGSGGTGVDIFAVFDANNKLHIAYNNFFQVIKWPPVSSEDMYSNFVYTTNESGSWQETVIDYQNRTFQGWRPAAIFIDSNNNIQIAAYHYGWYSYGGIPRVYTKPFGSGSFSYVDLSLPQSDNIDWPRWGTNQMFFEEDSSGFLNLWLGDYNVSSDTMLMKYVHFDGNSWILNSWNDSINMTAGSFSLVKVSTNDYRMVWKDKNTGYIKYYNLSSNDTVDVVQSSTATNPNVSIRENGSLSVSYIDNNTQYVRLRNSDGNWEDPYKMLTGSPYLTVSSLPSRSNGLVVNDKIAIKSLSDSNYYIDTPSNIATYVNSGFLGGSDVNNIGLRYHVPDDASVKISDLSFSSYPLKQGESIKFAIRFSNDNNNWTSLMGRDGNVIDWDNNYFGKKYGDAQAYFDLNQINMVFKYIDIVVKLETSDVNNTPTLNDLTITYNNITTISRENMFSWAEDADGGEEGWSNARTLGLYVGNIQGLPDSTNLHAEFELIDLRYEIFDGQNLLVGNSNGYDSEVFAFVEDGGIYTWRARL